MAPISNAAEHLALDSVVIYLLLFVIIRCIFYADCFVDLSRRLFNLFEMHPIKHTSN